MRLSRITLRFLAVSHCFVVSDGREIWQRTALAREVQQLEGRFSLTWWADTKLQMSATVGGNMCLKLRVSEKERKVELRVSGTAIV